MQHSPRVTLSNISVHFSGHTALSNIVWQLQQGQHWAICGHNGAGKSTLLRIIRGEQLPVPAVDGGVVWNLDGRPETTPLAIRKRIAVVSGEMQNHYIRQQWKMTGEEMILTGFFDSPLLYQQPTEEQRKAAIELAHALDVSHLLDIELPALSQGQLRKLLIARALVDKPAILVLDEVCEGLDAASRKDVLHTIDVAASERCSLLFTTHRLKELPASITHAMLLHAGNIQFQGPLDDVMPAITQALHTGEKANESSPPSALPPLPNIDSTSNTPVLELTDVDVYIDRQHVLHSIHWRVNAGENWAISGSNGAGKSTLMRLLLGDERQAWGGDVRWFGSSDMDITQLRKRIGHVSDRFQAAYGHDKYHGNLLNITGQELVWSGFTQSVGLWAWREVTEEQRTAALEWMKFLGIAEYAKQPMRDMSYGRLRRFMLCRAVAPGPELLLLDEPCSGLDPASRSAFLLTLQQLMQQGMQILYISHHESELLPQITHMLRLKEGRITYCGSREADT